MPTGLQLATRPRDGVPVRRRRIPKRQFAFVFNINRCIGCQTLHDGLQVHLDLLQGPGAHVVEQRRDQALRRLSASLGREDARPARAGQSRRPELGRRGAEDAQSALRRVQRQDHLRGGEDLPSARTGAAACSAICPPTRNGPRRTSTRTIPSGSEKAREGQYFNGGELLPEHKTWFFYLARICNHCTLSRPASPPVRARPSTSGPRTASC